MFTELRKEAAMGLTRHHAPLPGRRRADLAARRRPLPRAGEPDVGRARGARPVVDVHREVDVPGHPPVATLTLQPTRPGAATAPASTSSSASRSTAPAARRAVFSVSSPDSRAGRPVHDHPARQPRRRASRATSSSGPGPARWSTCPRPRATSSLPGPRARARRCSSPAAPASPR